ncbi:hypothetical protein, partial [Streptomyces lutosisoli]|uniref:hypothetical protein n=1 Tax=Streptomyces lutosisoli TaxID=2665721 RepID=UPI00361AD725
MPVPVDGETRLVEALPGPGLVAVVAVERAEQFHPVYPLGPFDLPGGHVGAVYDVFAREHPALGHVVVDTLGQ